MRNYFEKVLGKAWVWGAVLAVTVSPLRAAPLSIKLIESNAGKVASASVKRYGDQVYVAGSVYRGGNPVTGAHVHVEWHGPKGAMIASKTEGVNVTGRPSLVRTIPFTVGFPASQLSGAEMVQVFYSSNPHVFCSK